MPVAGLSTVTAISAAAVGAPTTTGPAPPSSVSRLVAVARLPRRKSRATVLSVVSGAGAARVGAATGGGGKAALVTHEASFPDTAPTTAAAWAGGGAAVLASASRYALWRPASGEVVTLIAFPADAPAVWPLAVSVTLPASAASPQPARPAVLLLVDQAGVLVSPDGTPAGPGLTFSPTAGPPSAVTPTGGRYLVAAGGAGLEVHDLLTGARLAALPFPGGARPAPGQRLLAASAGGGAGLAVVAGARKAWALVPVSPAERAAAALKAGDAAGALAAVVEGGGGGEGGAWAGAARAEAGLLHCARGEWAAGGAALASAQPGVDFEPAELWARGGCGELVAAAVAAAGEEEGAGGPAAATTRTARRALLGLGSSPEHAAAATAAAPPSSPSSVAVLVDVLLRCRRAGRATAAGDAVAAALLAKGGDARRLGALVGALKAECVTPAPALAAAGTALEAGGHSDALASLRVAAGDAAGALAVWRRVAESGGGGGGGGGEAAAAAAASSAARLLGDPVTCPDTALLTAHLPWVLRCEGVVSEDEEGEGASDDDAATPAGVLALAARAAALPPSAALALLSSSRARRQYLEVVLLGRDGGGGAPCSTDPALRATLALALARRAAALSSSSTSTSSSSSSLATVRASLARLLDPSAWSSPILDARSISAALEATPLWAERAAALEAGGDAPAAVRLLALSARDVGAARAVGARAAARAGPGEGPGEGGVAARVDAADAALLDLLLHPPPQPREGGPSASPEAPPPPPPRLAEAAALVSLPAVSLDPAQVLAAMPDGTPLSVAGPVLARLLAARTHRRRTAALERGLARGAHAAATASRADALSRAVLVPTAGRACRACRARIGLGRVFAVDGRDGGLACGTCAGVVAMGSGGGKV